jgi:chemotaxis signal transduction protein
MGEPGLTLDELLAGLEREVARTWREREAAAGVPSPADAEGERCLVISSGSRRIAVPARAVLAVSEMPPVAAVPFSPHWLRGLTRAMGRVVAVVDLARLLAAGSALSAPPGVAPLDEAVRETLLVVQTADGKLDAGLAVLGIARLITLPGLPGRLPAAGELEAWPVALVAGLVPDPGGADLPPVAILDVDRLLGGARAELDA